MKTAIHFKKLLENTWIQKKKNTRSKNKKSNFKYGLRLKKKKNTKNNQTNKKRDILMDQKNILKKQKRHGKKEQKKRS